MFYIKKENRLQSGANLLFIIIIIIIIIWIMHPSKYQRMHP
jgi:heme/copper-type cytochrome/quinol oxidase subunit 4